MVVGLALGGVSRWEGGVRGGSRSSKVVLAGGGHKSENDSDACCVAVFSFAFEAHGRRVWR